MAEIKNRYRTIKIDTKDKQIVDTNTGELSEIKNGSLIKKVGTKEVEISYNDYVYLDTEKLKILLEKGIKQVELALLVSISGNLLNRYNICMQNEDEPQDTNSIAKLVGQSVQRTKSKLNELVKIGVLEYITMKNKENWGKVYIVNPHFIRIGRYFTKSLPELFDDIKEEKNEFS